MKTLIFIATFLAAFQLPAAHADDPAGNDPRIVVNEQAKSFMLYWTGAKKEKMQLRIKDASGAILTDQKFRGGKTVTQRYDLSQLATGSFFLELEEAFEIHRYPVSVMQDRIAIPQDEAGKIYKPIIEKRNNAFDLNLLLGDGEGSVSLSNDSGETVFQDELSGESAINKRYNLNLLKDGAYTVAVSTHGYVFYENVIVR